ncbi:tRNA (adenosine(37)-N6)-threonylcarbamoyltransferase complex ATPase subunit type 1 TsaE [Candidatus Saccharibacteria bacterium]|nr:tRNA (adenosine(37)-N6)-threonylcarbamoyltransferase complex ATPase subunit type 1 TsaE [Candidatus Saccharibacteria bacterium]
MEIRSEKELIKYGKRLADDLKPPAALELVGDVGAGKTTLVRGIAEGLGVKELVTSPSFTISKRYPFAGGVLVHYDFYRLTDPGIMREEIAETLNDPKAIVVIEWGESVTDLLPEKHTRIEIKLQDDNTRLIKQ